MSTTGGIYTYTCDCGSTFEAFKWDEESQFAPCGCGKRAPRRRVSPKHAGMAYDRPVYSESLGVHPDQVQAHRKLHPGIEMTDGGQVVMRSHYDRKRILKYFGYTDKAKR